MSHDGQPPQAFAPVAFFEPNQVSCIEKIIHRQHNGDRVEVWWDFDETLALDNYLSHEALLMIPWRLYPAFARSPRLYSWFGRQRTNFMRPSWIALQYPHAVRNILTSRYDLERPAVHKWCFKHDILPDNVMARPCHQLGEQARAVFKAEFLNQRHLAGPNKLIVLIDDEAKKVRSRFDQLRQNAVR